MEWKISKSRRTCEKCEKELAEKERYVSALFDKPEAFERIDFCEACWAVDPPETFSHWQTRVPEKEEDRRRMVDLGVLTDIFVRLAGEASREKQNFRYLLALILLRKRALKLDRTLYENGDEYLIMVEPKEGREHPVLNPRMTDEETEAVQAQLAQVFEADFSEQT